MIVPTACVIFEATLKFASRVVDRVIAVLQSVCTYENSWPKVANVVSNTCDRLLQFCSRLINRPDSLPATSPSYWGGSHTLGGDIACVCVPG